MFIVCIAIVRVDLDNNEIQDLPQSDPVLHVTASLLKAGVTSNGNAMFLCSVREVK